MRVSWVAGVHLAPASTKSYYTTSMLPHLSELGLDVGTQDGNKIKLLRSLSSNRNNMCALSRGHVGNSGRHSPPLPQIQKELHLYTQSSVSTRGVSPWRPIFAPGRAPGKPFDEGQNPYEDQPPQPHVQQEHNRQLFQCQGGEQQNLNIPSYTTEPPRALVAAWNHPLDAPWNCQTTRDQMSSVYIQRHGTNASQVVLGAPGDGGKESGPVNLLPSNYVDMDDTNGDDIRRASDTLVCITKKSERSASCHSISVPQSSQDFHSPSRTVTTSRIQNFIGFMDENQKMNGQIDPHSVNRDRAVGPNSSTTSNFVRWIRSPDRGSSSMASTWGRASPSPRSTNRYDPQEERSESISPVISKSSKKSLTHLSPRQSHNIHDLGAIGAIEELHTGLPEFRHGPHQARANSAISSKTTTRVSDNGGVTKRRSMSMPKSQFQCTILKDCDAVFTCNSLRK